MTSFNTAHADDLPNDLDWLKACINRQTILLGQQIIELDYLREDVRKQQLQNSRLRALLTPKN